MSKKASRNSNFEVLRIISMLLIIAFHATRMGYLSEEQPTVVRITGIVLGSWGILGVDLFLLISVWFLVEQQFRIKRIIRLVFQVITYSLFFNGIRIYLKWKEAPIAGAFLKNCTKLFLKDISQPLWAKCYWFVTSYLFMLLLSPFINRFLTKCSRETIKKILVIGLFIPIYANFQTSTVCDILFFCYIYLLVGFVKKYDLDKLRKWENWGGICTVTAIIIASKIGGMNMDESGWSGICKNVLNFSVANTGKHSLIVLLLAWLVFGMACKKKAFNNKLVNAMAGATFGVYLFHEAYFFGTVDHIFAKLTDFGWIGEGLIFPVQYIGATLFVFTLGVIVELMRQIVLQRPFERYISEQKSQEMKKIENWFDL